MKNGISSSAALLFILVTVTAAQEDPPKEHDYDTAPVLLQMVEAIYPEEARAAEVEGEVMLRIRVKADGTTSSLSVIRSLGQGCDEAAIEAAKQWTWEPALKAGEPVEAVGIISLRFPPRKDR